MPVYDDQHISSLVWLCRTLYIHGLSLLLRSCIRSGEYVCLIEMANRIWECLWTSHVKQPAHHLETCAWNHRLRNRCETQRWRTMADRRLAAPGITVVQQVRQFLFQRPAVFCPESRMQMLDGVFFRLDFTLDKDSMFVRCWMLSSSFGVDSSGSDTAVTLLAGRIRMRERCDGGVN